jgi:hypothetical protein
LQKEIFLPITAIYIWLLVPFGYYIIKKINKARNKRQKNFSMIAAEKSGNFFLPLFPLQPNVPE